MNYNGDTQIAKQMARGQVPFNEIRTLIILDNVFILFALFMHNV